MERIQFKENLPATLIQKLWLVPLGSFAFFLFLSSCASPPPPPFDFKTAKTKGWFAPDSLPPAEKPNLKIPESLGSLDGAVLNLTGEWRTDKTIVSPFNDRESPANTGRNKRRSFNSKVTLPWGFKHTFSNGQDSICETAGKVTLCLSNGYSLEATLTQVNENTVGIAIKIDEKLGQESWQAVSNHVVAFGSTAEVQLSTSDFETAKKKPDERRQLAIRMTVNRIQSRQPQQKQ